MEIQVTSSNDVEKRISDAFCIFDHHGDKTIDVREVGTVLRFLGCVPTEQDVNEVIAATETEDSSGEVQLIKFMPYVAQLLAERKMEPAAPDKLLNAFHVLDPERKGYLLPAEFAKIMMEEGEPFTKEEVDEMMAVAVDPITNHVAYEFYLNHLMYKSKNSIFDLAEKHAQEKAKTSKQMRSSKINTDLMNAVLSGMTIRSSMAQR